MLDRLVLGEPLAERLGVALCEALMELLAELDSEDDGLGVSEADAEPLVVSEALAATVELALAVALAEGLGVALCEAPTELLAEIDDEGDRLGVSEADAELLADSDAVAAAVKLTLCVLLAVRLDDELCVALLELLKEVVGEVDRLGVSEADAEPLADCDAVTSAVKLLLGVLLPVRLNLELCEAVTVLLRLVEGVALGETLAVAVAAALPVVEPLIEGVAVTTALTLVEGATLGEAVAAALANQDTDELAVTLVEGVALGETLIVAVAAALPVVEPLIEGVAVTTALTLVEGVTLGETLAVNVTAALPVGETLLDSDIDTAALADQDTDELAVRLGEGVKLGEKLGVTVSTALAVDEVLIEGVTVTAAMSVIEALGEAEHDGDSDAVKGASDGDRPQSCAMTATTSACVSAYAYTRTLSISPVKKPGKLVVPEPPTVRHVAIKLTALLYGLMPENSAATASAPSTYTVRFVPSNAYAKWCQRLSARANEEQVLAAVPENMPTMLLQTQLG